MNFFKNKKFAKNAPIRLSAEAGVSLVSVMMLAAVLGFGILAFTSIERFHQKTYQSLSSANFYEEIADDFAVFARARLLSFMYSGMQCNLMGQNSVYGRPYFLRAGAQEKSQLSYVSLATEADFSFLSSIPSSEGKTALMYAKQRCSDATLGGWSASTTNGTYSTSMKFCSKLNLLPSIRSSKAHKSYPMFAEADLEFVDLATDQSKTCSEALANIKPNTKTTYGGFLRYTLYWFDQGGQAPKSYSGMTYVAFEYGKLLYYNRKCPLDVNDDGRIEPLDLLMIIDFANRAGGGEVLSPPINITGTYPDVNGDGWITLSDRSAVIDFLNNNGSSTACP